MKKLNLLVMMFMMMVNMSFGQSILKGDMDDDGKLTIKDVTALVETINGKTAEKSIKVDTTPIKLASGESIWLSFENGVIKLNCSKDAINKIPITITAPTAKTLTANGSAQALVNAGSCSTAGAVTFEYKLSTESEYKSTIPTATDAGSYVVNWRANVNTDYYTTSNNTSGTILVTISAAPSVEVKGYYGWTSQSNVDNLSEFDESLFTNSINTNIKVLEGTDLSIGQCLLVATPNSNKPIIKQINAGLEGNLSVSSGNTWEVNNTIEKDGKTWYIWINTSAITNTVSKITITIL